MVIMNGVVAKLYRETNYREGVKLTKKIGN